jgi:hypothetical protein
MQNINFTKCDLLADKDNVDLDVLGAAVMNRISYHVNNTDVVTKDNRGRG